MTAIKFHNRRALKQVITTLFMLLFLFTAFTGALTAPAANELTEAEINEANQLSVSINTLFSFTIPKSEYVRFSIFDLKGREILVLIDENKKAGEFSTDLNNSNLVKGTYYYRLVVGRFKEIRKIEIHR
ncbi:MAG: T9SS type A sorting domain-containing protein [Ignavibacteria bacterium]